RDNYYLDMVGRLRPGVTPVQAQADLAAVVKAVNATVGAVAMDLQQSQVGDIRSTLLLLMGGVMCVLLFACANGANLVLVRRAGVDCINDGAIGHRLQPRTGVTALRRSRRGCFEGVRSRLYK